MKVLLLLLLSAVATNAHFVVDCIASSHNTLTSIYASHGGTDNSTIARCLPNDHLVEFTTSVKSDQYGIAVPSCTDLDAERNPMPVYPGQTIFYSYVGIPLEGTGVVVDSAEATIVGVNTSSIILDDNSTSTLTDFSKLPTEHAITQRCDNNSTICSGTISFPNDINLGSLNITIAWPVYEQESTIETNPIQSIPTPKKVGYATSCVKFNVVNKGHGVERALIANKLRRLRNQAAKPRNLLDQGGEERKLWPFALDQTNEDINSRELRNQVVEERELRNQVMEERELRNQVMEERELRNQVMEERELRNQVMEGRELRNQVMEGRELRNQVMEGRELRNQVMEGHSGCIRSTPGKMCKQSRKLQEQPPNKDMPQVTIMHKLRNRDEMRELRNQANDVSESALDSNKGLAYFLNKVGMMARRKLPTPAPWSSPPPPGPHEAAGQEHRGLRDRAMDINDARNSIVDEPSIISRNLKQQLGMPHKWWEWFW